MKENYPQRMKLSEISSATGVSHGTAYNSLMTFCEKGYAVEHGHYGLQTGRDPLTYSLSGPGFQLAKKLSDELKEEE